MNKAGARVLVIGGGGREHALAWRLSISPRVAQVIVAPGSDGYPSTWERWPAKLSDGVEEFGRLAKRARQVGVDLAVIGPDNPLADGIVDVFEGFGLRTFGPSKAAARLESSKSFAKEIMRAAGVPTAQFRVVTTIEECLQTLQIEAWARGGAVVKADGLAFGKGVKVCFSADETMAAARELLPISGKLVLEERLTGEELSWLALCDGSRCALLEPARDYKRLQDGGEGPNTGGMGAFSPVPGVTPELGEAVREQVFMPVLREMNHRGTPFRGVLYAGLMADLAAGKFSVIEFNARFGDPETQVLMPRLEGDFYDWCEAVAVGDLGDRPDTVPFKRESAVFVVGAAAGYPDAPERGRPITGPLTGALAAVGSCPEFFVAGVSAGADGVVTAGGRVFGALGTGSDLGIARRQAYERLMKVRFAGMQYRTDIAKAEIGVLG